MKSLSIAVQARKAVILMGMPGVGKTEYVKAMGRALGEPVVDIIASIREPSDFGGLPKLTDDGVLLVPPAWARFLREQERGILFLDEITTAPPAVQAALLRVVLERVVGECELGDNIAIVAAANPPEVAAGGWELSPPLANRFVWLHWRNDPKVWIEGSLAGWPEPKLDVLPANWKTHIPQAMALITGYISTRPHKLHHMPEEAAKRSGPWPSNRSWTVAAELMAACEAAGASMDPKLELVAGCIGDGEAVEFIKWLKALDLPRPEDVLSNPRGYKLPKDRGDQVFAILCSVTAYVVNELNRVGSKKKDRQKIWEQAWSALGYAAEEGQKDAAAVAAKTLVGSNQADLDVAPVAKDLKQFKGLLDAAGIKAAS